MSRSDAKVAHRRKTKVASRRRKAPPPRRHSPDRNPLSLKRQQEMLAATAFAQANVE
jgi:hypothetical protein